MTQITSRRNKSTPSGGTAPPPSSPQSVSTQQHGRSSSTNTSSTDEASTDDGRLQHHHMCSRPCYTINGPANPLLPSFSGSRFRPVKWQESWSPPDERSAPVTASNSTESDSTAAMSGDEALRWPGIRPEDCDGQHRNGKDNAEKKDSAPAPPREKE
ncbi:hypothetical protein E8E14_002987 [Neopestalotiopsis sp. 37M]|nr:hypothetical protein E8E14_002987 [Neopestalotiopsis sp. 37M]